MKETLEKQNRRSGVKILLPVNGVLMLLLVYFAWTTVYSSDDYWYSTFWNEGLTHYLEMMVFHYQTINGRMLVHALAHIVLHFDSWAYALVCCGQCVIAAWAVTKASGMKRDRFHAVLFVLLTGILCMPLEIFSQGLMWISASCNYLFPVVLSSLLITALVGESWWALLLAFLCGATTEQMGLAVTAVCLVWTGLALRRRRGALRYGLCTLLALGGVLTIFLSPATRLRAEQHVRFEELLEIMQKDLLLEIEHLTANPVPLLIMLAVLGFGALALWSGAGLRWPAVPAALGAAALIVGSFGSDVASMVGYGIGFASLAVLGWMLLIRDYETVGSLILTGLASAAVMLPTDTIGPRVMLPVYLLLLLAGGCLLVMQLPRVERLAIPAAAALAVILVISVPAVRGFWHNFQMDARNKAFAREDAQKPFVRYCIDYDMDYTWVKASFDGYFQTKYVESVGLPMTTPVRFFSEKEQMDLIRCNNQELVWLSVLRDDGTVLFPLGEVVETIGGSLDWYGNWMVVELDGISYELRTPDEDTVVATWTEVSGAEHEIWGVRTLACSATYCSSEILTDAFDLKIAWDEQSGCYMISQ